MTPDWNNGTIGYRNIGVRDVSKNIGERPAFPNDPNIQAGVSLNSGMSYRQWLIGMALQGQLSNIETLTALAKSSSVRGIKFTEAIAASTIENADAVLAELAKE